MHASIAIVSALVAAAAANTAYTTVEKTVTSCAPGGERDLNLGEVNLSTDDQQSRAAQARTRPLLRKPTPSTALFR